MSKKNRVSALEKEVPPAGPMFTRRLLLGYSGIALLIVGVSTSFGLVSASATSFGLDAFFDSLIVATIAGCFFAGLLGFSLRGGRRPLILLPIGYALLAGYAGILIWYLILQLAPGMIVDRSLVILAHFAAIFLLLLIPAAFFVWRLVRDPALH